MYQFTCACKNMWIRNILKNGASTRFNEKISNNLRLRRNHLQHISMGCHELDTEHIMM